MGLFCTQSWVTELLSTMSAICTGFVSQQDKSCLSEGFSWITVQDALVSNSKIGCISRDISVTSEASPSGISLASIQSDIYWCRFGLAQNTEIELEQGRAAQRSRLMSPKCTSGVVSTCWVQLDNWTSNYYGSRWKQFQFSSDLQWFPKDAFPLWILKNGLQLQHRKECMQFSHKGSFASLMPTDKVWNTFSFRPPTEFYRSTWLDSLRPRHGAYPGSSKEI